MLSYVFVCVCNCLYQRWLCARMYKSYVHNQHPHVKFSVFIRRRLSTHTHTYTHIRKLNFFYYSRTMYICIIIIIQHHAHKLNIRVYPMDGRCVYMMRVWLNSCARPGNRLKNEHVVYETTVNGPNGRTAFA